MSTARAIRNKRGFTLVEILIVVVILGILATVVIAGFKPTAELTKANNTYALLKTLRSQLELYKVHHNEDYPALADLWGALTERTDADGNILPTGDFGPYLTREPLNQFTLSDTVVAPAGGTANDGWEYNEINGRIIAVGFDEATGVYTAP